MNSKNKFWEKYTIKIFMNPIIVGFTLFILACCAQHADSQIEELVLTYYYRYLGLKNYKMGQKVSKNPSIVFFSLKTGQKQ